MTGNSLENSGLQEGNPEQPNSGASNANQGTSGEQVAITKAEWDSLQKKIKTLESEDRSKKDKAVKNVSEGLTRLEEKVTPLLERAAQFMQSGDSPQVAIQKANSELDEVETKQALRDLAQAFRSGKLLDPSVGSVNGSNVEALKVFEELGVNPNHPEASTLFNLKGEELIKGVAKLAIKTKSTSTVDSSEAPSLQSAPAQQAGVKELTEKYQRDLLATPRGKAGDSQRRQLKEQARKNGVPVDSIAFV
jgi:hypothetical protein